MIKLSLKQNIMAQLTQFFIAIVITTSLFGALSILSKGAGVQKTKKSPGVLISYKKPPPPPDPEMDERDKIMEKKQIERKRIKQSRPGIDLLNTDLMTGGIKIPGLQHSIEIPKFDFKVGFNLDEIDEAPVVINQLAPRYPYHAKREKIEGVVIIRFLVTRKGCVEDISIMKSDPKDIFDDATRQSVSRWKFKPGIKDGKAVETWVEIEIEFELDKG